MESIHVSPLTSELRVSTLCVKEGGGRKGRRREGGRKVGREGEGERKGEKGRESEGSTCSSVEDAKKRRKVDGKQET